VVPQQFFGGGSFDNPLEHPAKSGIMVFDEVIKSVEIHTLILRSKTLSMKGLNSKKPGTGSASYVPMPKPLASG